ncbi:MAG: DNA adenine methylase [Xenococcaceae cyanobacterium MO_167.B52]|nr:DNA adenine methylase [Xenococcaceae cyanobacterium MO_167.B52]
MSINQNLAKPFLKWVGGKTQLLGQLENFYPSELKEGKIDKYFELFVGGGAVFFEVMQKYTIKKAFINDINQDLILAYRVIRDRAPELIEILSQLQAEYLNSNLKERSNIFYQVRENYNQQRINFSYDGGGYWGNPSISNHSVDNLSEESIKRVALIIFLNKTCFNGLYRTNKKGDFNVPMGRYKNPTICNSDNIFKVSNLLKNVTIISGNYDIFSQYIDSKSLVYLDPPYRPISNTSSFTAYAKSSFNDDSQIKLSQYYQYLDQECQAKVMLSNSDPRNTDSEDSFFDDLYSKYNIHRVSASRMVNSKASNRGKIRELLITNY